MTNFEKIKGMTIVEMALFFSPTCMCCPYKHGRCDGIGCVNGIMEYLQQEAEEDKP